MDEIAEEPALTNGGAVMLTGNQIAAARALAGFNSQLALAKAADVSRPTIERAEGARNEIPGMGTDAMAKIVRALERAGVEFYLDGGSLAGGIGIRLRSQPRAQR